jgi:hypothetical protein
MTFQSFNVEAAVWHDRDFELLEQSLVHAPDLLIFTLCWEPAPLKRWQHRLTALIEHAKSLNKQVVLIINSYYSNQHQQLLNCGAKQILFLDYFLLLVYVRLFQNCESKVAQSWDAKNSTWLFLTGKPNKPNRLEFLYFLYQQKLLDQCVWSLFVPTDLQAELELRLTGLTESQASEWLQQFKRNPDNIKIIKTPPDIHYSGIPYGDVYESALFQIVPESKCTGTTPWLTEKTWLSIVNRRPFMIFGVPGTNHALKTLGFDTYDKFLIDFEFDQDQSIENRYASLAKNIRHWLKILPKHEQELANITEHNYNRFIKLANTNIDQLQTLHQDIHQLISLKDEIQHAQWKNWYNRIKDPLWPHCDQEKDFQNLPEWIQQECVEVFGYQPKENL